MKVTCTRCHVPVELSRRQAMAWTKKAALPFVCDACLGKQIKKAVVNSEAAKAEADTRTFQTINLNPTIHENPNRRTRLTQP